MPEKVILHTCSGLEELQSVRFECIAENAYKIDWTMDGIPVKQCKSVTLGRSVISVLSYQYNTTSHDNDNDTEVLCTAWGGLDRTTNVTSQPATISVIRKC